MVHLIVGYGEVGRSLGKVLGNNKVYIHDEAQGFSVTLDEKVDVVHICIPYNKDFNETVAFWQKTYGFIIVHSSVPVGTCDRLKAVHSPIAGVHPHLEKGIRTFVKYFGGERANEAAKIFKKLGLKTRVYPEARITEAMKLWSTTQYGMMLMIEKQIYAWCQENNLPFEEVYTRSNIDYNEGYTKLGMKNVVRPYYKHMDGPIGGHCIIPNAKLLKVKL